MKALRMRHKGVVARDADGDGEKNGYVLHSNEKGDDTMEGTGTEIVRDMGPGGFIQRGRSDRQSDNVLKQQVRR